MRSINLDLDYRLRPRDREQFETNRDISVFLVLEAAGAVHQKLNRNDSRIFGRIQDQLYEYTQNALELERSEYEWLRDVFDKVELRPLFATWLNTFRRELKQWENGEEKPETEGHKV